MPTRISLSRPKKSTAHRLLCDPERTTAMELLALNSAQHRFTKRWSLELGSSPDKPLVIGHDSRFHSEDWGSSGEVRLPGIGSSEEQRDKSAHSGMSPTTNPVHARSLLRGKHPLRPAARRRSAFPVPSGTSLKTAAKSAAQTSTGLRPRKHSLALGSMGPFA